MLKSYIKIAIRNIRNHKYHSILSVTGLSLGLAAFLLIIFYIFNEISYDLFNTNAYRIYRIATITEKDGVGERSASCPFPLAEKIEKQFPEYVEKTLRLFNLNSPSLPLKINGETIHQKNVFLCDTTIFSFFDLRMEESQKKQLFQNDNSVIISQSFANKNFPKGNYVGDSIYFFQTKTYLKITGTYKDLPNQSHWHPSVLINLNNFINVYGDQIKDNMLWNPFWTYVLLKKGINPDQLETQLHKLTDYNNNIYDDFIIYMQPLADIHLNSHLQFEIEQNGKQYYVNILFWIALLIIVLAATNFVNLSTANAIYRAKEIGIRKTIGASKRQIFTQFIVESLILTFISLIFALAIIELFLPFFRFYVDSNFRVHLNYSIFSIITFSCIGLIIGLSSGIYPSIYLSSFNPLNAIKGIVKSRNHILRARVFLVFVQFFISSVLIIASLFVYNQIKHIQNLDLGFEKENIILLEVNDTYIPKNFESFKSDLLKNPNIAYVTGMQYPIGISHNTTIFNTDTSGNVKNNELYPYNSVNFDFIKTFKIKIIEGQDFSEYNNNYIDGILINEEMVKHKGWTIKNAIGRQMAQEDIKTKVIGVYQNFYNSSVLSPTVPFILTMAPDKKYINYITKYVAIRFNEENQSVIDYIESTWNKYNTNKTFEFKYLKKELKELYKNEYKIANFVVPFTLLAIIIAIIGLMGLTTYTCYQKRNEIGIRKTIGASMFSIIKLISKEFVIIALIGNILSWPVSYYLVKQWLETFNSHTPINWIFFALSAIIVISLALSISAWKAYIAAKTKPANSLNRK